MNWEAAGGAELVHGCEGRRGRSVGPTSLGEMKLRYEKSVRDGPTIILWDLLGTCNLRCPACGAGARPGINGKGMISDETFSRILQKLRTESSCRQLSLYNWSEPLLHPRIVNYCRAAAEMDFHVHLSSNLNHVKDADGLMDAGIKSLRISLSGFTQAIYEIGHRGGDVERVKENMRRLAAARDRLKSRTQVLVYYHKYRHNIHEIDLMKAFARELGFDFDSDWAFYTPLERLVAYLEGETYESGSDFIREAIMPDVKTAVRMMSPHRNRPCEAIDQLALNRHGDAMLCCALYDERIAKVGNILSMDWSELQRIRYGHEMCRKCMEHGVHVLYGHYQVPELRAMIEEAARAELKSKSDAEPKDVRAGRNLVNAVEEHG